MESFLRRLSELLFTLGHETKIVLTDESPTSSPCETITIADLLGRPSQAHDAALSKLGIVLGSWMPDLVLTHQAAHGGLLDWLQSKAPTVEVLHSFACQGGKLFRRRDTVCTHPVSRRCLWDWYVGPCGTAQAPWDAIHAYESARSHLAALRRIHGVIVGSEFMRKYAVGEGIAEQSLWVADFDVMLPVEREQPLTTKRHSILFVGRLVYSKGVQYAIEALNRLGPEYSLTIVGDGWYRDGLEQLAAQRGLNSRVQFTGTLIGSALETEFSRAGVVVVPSIWPEPVGLVVPEARGYGLPVVVFDSGGLAEWKSKYRNIHVAKPVDAGSLARAIESATAPTPLATPIVAASRPAKSLVSVLELLATHGKGYGWSP
jgi:glycosyltransferase involved in cell wall biosynthesis